LICVSLGHFISCAACFCCVCFSLFSTNQYQARRLAGKCIRNYLFCVECDV